MRTSQAVFLCLHNHGAVQSNSTTETLEQNSTQFCQFELHLKRT